MSVLQYMRIHGFLGCQGCLRIFVTEKAKTNELTNQEKKMQDCQVLETSAQCINNANPTTQFYT